MKYPNTNKIPVLETKNALGFKLADTKFSEIVELYLEKDGKIEDHALDINVVFYVVAGKGTIGINSTLLHAESGDIIEVEAGALRSWINTSIETLKLLVIKQKK